MTEQYIALIELPTGMLGAHRVEVTDGVIASMEPTDEKPDLRILPGLADVHNHGAVGESFPTSDLDGCRAAAHYHRSRGTTTLLASTVSLPEHLLLPQLSVLADLTDLGEIDGIHAEGPFVNACRCGAQNPAAIIPGDPDLLTRMIEVSRGHLKSITFAPETARMRELVDICATHGVIVSFGHTDASFAEMNVAVIQAVEAGATVTATHLFNAMPPLHHRDPGSVAALLTAATRGEAVVELIADGVHLADDTVNMVLSTVGADRVTFVSDAMAAAGRADGQYILGELDVTVASGVARLSTPNGSEGAIAGGTSTVIEQVWRQVQHGRLLQDALTAATTGHRLLGVEHRSRIEVGTPANFVVCGPDFIVRKVYREGQEVSP